MTNMLDKIPALEKILKPRDKLGTSNLEQRERLILQLKLHELLKQFGC